MPDTSIKDFEAAIAELESVVKKLEEGDLPLEQSLALYERGVQLSRFCHARLEEAERRIEILTERGEIRAALHPVWRRCSSLKYSRYSRSSRLASRAHRRRLRASLIVTVAESLAAFLDAARLRVDAALEAYLPRPPACPPLVSEAMRYSVFAGGKRLRSVLALAAADAIARVKWGRGYFSAPAGGENIPVPISLALPAACAIELIHTYSLIHDDLPAMDNDMLRRGRPTLHVVYGDGIAILAGDGLQAEAFGLLAREPATNDPEIIARKLRVLGIVAGAAGATGMVGGQAIDLQAAGQAAGHALTLDAEGLRGMHARKTGALITAAAVSGSVMAGGDDRLIAGITEYAAELGLAFQIVDDVLDVEGDAKTLGKTAGKDAASAKPSYPALYGIDRSRAMAAECVEQAKAALDQVDLAAGWLSPIADWVRSRTS